MYVSLQRFKHHYEIIIDRPERMNGLGTTIARECLEILQQLIDEINAEPSQRSLVALRARPVKRPGGRKVWIAGGDLKETAELLTSDDGDRYASQYRHICDQLENLPIPVIAAIDGETIGGGIELTLAADIRLASMDSHFHFKQLSLGLATGYGGCRRLVELLGTGTASHLLLLSQSIDASKALELGLVEELHPTTSALESRLAALGEKLSQVNPMALAMQKTMLRQAMSDGRDMALSRERWLFRELWMNPYHRQSLAKFSPGLSTSESDSSKSR